MAEAYIYASSREIIDKLGLPLMVHKNQDSFNTAFTVSIDASDCATGISAYEKGTHNTGLPAR